MMYSRKVQKSDAFGVFLRLKLRTATMDSYFTHGQLDLRATRLSPARPRREVGDATRRDLRNRNAKGANKKSRRTNISRKS